ncbi:MAG: response regulator [Bdellovibrionales bacterium]|nr:response regulator [Bdellovibrionales bacterium]
MLNILLVDDEPFIREILRERLAHHFGPGIMTFTEASSGRAAQELINIGKTFDLIISDFRMSNGDGLELMDYVLGSKSISLFILFTSEAEICVNHADHRFLGVIEKLNFSGLCELLALGICMGRSNDDKKM